jgi:putative protease
MKKPELLAPAGNMEKLEFAFRYGADACYLAGQAYGLRAGAGNFTLDEMKEALAFAREHGKKIYVTVNIFPHNEDLEGLPAYLAKLQELGVDGVIVADPGVFFLAKRYCPRLSIHISTQANSTSWASVKFWEEQGAGRIVLAREISLADIKEIRQKVHAELEAFVHGAMCISYSGRCLMSNYMIGRDANRGECAHPCRWKYHLVEEKRPGEYYPVEEDARGTYIFNSKDLCLLEYIPELVQAGIDSFKIEGRMKSVHYVATVVKAYREAIDAYYANPEEYQVNPQWSIELAKVSHRDYFTGFYFAKPKSADHNYTTSQYLRSYDFVGVVRDYCPESKTAVIEERNRIHVGEELEFLGPTGPAFRAELRQMWDEETKEEIQAAPHPHQIIRIPLEIPVKPYTLVRRFAGEKPKEARR